MYARSLLLTSLLFLYGCASDPPEKDDSSSSGGLIGSVAARDDAPKKSDPSKKEADVQSPVLPIPEQADDEDKAKLAEMASGELRGARPISSRSLSLKVSLGEGTKAAFKPMRKGNGTARYEVAYYRLSKALNLGGVPASTMRLLPRARVVGHLDKHFPEAAAAFQSEARDYGSGQVGGAVIEWLEGLEPTGLDGKSGRKRLGELLSLNGAEEGTEDLARQASNMVVADYVMGNWDRFSGGNLFVRGGILILVDNNGSFGRWSQRQNGRMNGTLDICSKFSRAFIKNLRQLDSDAIDQSLAGESWHGVRPLLTKEEIARVLERRDIVIERVDRLIRENTTQEILVFP